MNANITLKEKLDDWRFRLEGDDPHSITEQIVTMLWRSAFYRSINESRKYLPVDNECPIANGTLHEFLHDGYVAMHAGSVRRLIDKGCPTGPKGINSLYALIQDIQNHCHLLTRKQMFAARELEYDYEPAKLRALEHAKQKAAAKKQKAYFVDPTGWQQSECWHTLWDELCETDAERRSPDDTPDIHRFSRLLDDLWHEGERVIEFSHKYIAHAAWIESRQSVPMDFQKVSLAIFWKSERAIVRAASFVAQHVITGVNCGGVPIPQFDQFQHMDASFANHNAIQAMQEAWNAHTREIDCCQNWCWDQPLTNQADVWKDDHS